MSQCCLIKPCGLHVEQIGQSHGKPKHGTELTRFKLIELQAWRPESKLPIDLPFLY